MFFALCSFFLVGSCVGVLCVVCVFGGFERWVKGKGERQGFEVGEGERMKG